MPRFGAISYWGGAGPGQLDTRTFSNPGIGTQFFFTTPTNEIWELIAVRCRLATNATVNNRRGVLRYDPVSGGVVPYRCVQTATQPASTTYEHYWGQGGTVNLAAAVGVSAGGSIITQCGIPRILTTPGGDLHIDFDLLSTGGAGDQISAVEMIALVWLV